MEVQKPTKKSIQFAASLDDLGLVLEVVDEGIDCLDEDAALAHWRVLDGHHLVRGGKVHAADALGGEDLDGFLLGLEGDMRENKGREWGILMVKLMFFLSNCTQLDTSMPSQTSFRHASTWHSRTGHSPS